MPGISLRLPDPKTAPMSTREMTHELCKAIEYQEEVELETEFGVKVGQVHRLFRIRDKWYAELFHKSGVSPWGTGYNQWRTIVINDLRTVNRTGKAFKAHPTYRAKPKYERGKVTKQLGGKPRVGVQDQGEQMLLQQTLEARRGAIRRRVRQ